MTGAGGDEWCRVWRAFRPGEEHRSPSLTVHPAYQGPLHLRPDGRRGASQAWCCIFSFVFSTPVESASLAVSGSQAALQVWTGPPSTQAVLPHFVRTCQAPSRRPEPSARTQVLDRVTQSFCEDQFPFTSSGLTLRNARGPDGVEQAELRQLGSPPPPGGSAPVLCRAAGGGQAEFSGLQLLVG